MHNVVQRDNMVVADTGRLIATVFDKLTKMRELRSKWLTDELIVMIIQHVSKTKQIEINVNKTHIE